MTILLRGSDTVPVAHIAAGYRIVIPTERSAVEGPAVSPAAMRLSSLLKTTLDKSDFQPSLGTRAEFSAACLAPEVRFP